MTAYHDFHGYFRLYGPIRVCHARENRRSSRNVRARRSGDFRYIASISSRAPQRTADDACGLPPLVNPDSRRRSCDSVPGRAKGCTPVWIAASGHDSSHARMGPMVPPMALPAPSAEEPVLLRHKPSNLDASLLQHAMRSRVCRVRDRLDLCQAGHIIGGATPGAPPDDDILADAHQYGCAARRGCVRNVRWAQHQSRCFDLARPASRRELPH